MTKIFKVLTLMLAMSLIVGCSTKGPEKEGEITKLVMYLPGDPASNHDEIMAEANAIIREEINAELDLKFVNWGEFATKMNLWLSTGEKGIDIVTTGGLGTESYILNAQRGALSDLTELVQTHAKEAMEKLDPAYITANTIDGKLYGMPANANLYGEAVIAINPTFLEKYDLSIEGIKDYEDLIPLLEVIKANEPSVTPFYVSDNKVVAGLDYVLSDNLPFAVDMSGDDTKIINPYEHEGYIGKLKGKRAIYAAGLTNADPVAIDFPWEQDTWFANMTETGPSDFEDYLLGMVAGKEVKLISMQTPIIDKTHALMSSMIIPNNAKNKEKSVELMNLMYTNKDLMTTLGYGIEGQNWEKVGTDQLRKLPEYDSTKQYSPWNYGDKMNMYRDEAITDEQVASITKKLELAVVSPVLAFNLNTEPFKAELANIQNVMEKYTTSLHAGVIDTEQGISSMMVELKEAGYEKVMKEIQTQYDAFNKK